MATRLALVIQSSNSCRLAWEVGANEVFVVMSRDIVEMLKERGTSPFYEWNVPDSERKLENILLIFGTSYRTASVCSVPLIKII